MSCHSCSGCFTGTSCSSKTSKKDAVDDKIRFQTLLELAASKDSTSTFNKEHDHIIPTIMAELSKNVYASQTVLFQAHDVLSQREFLSLAADLYQFKILGAHIAWAFEFCENDVQKLFQLLEDTTNEDNKLKLVQHCNEHAELHELLGNLPTGSAGRTALPEK